MDGLEKFLQEKRTFKIIDKEGWAEVYFKIQFGGIFVQDWEVAKNILYVEPGNLTGFPFELAMLFVKYFAKEREIIQDDAFPFIDVEEEPGNPFFAIEQGKLLFIDDIDGKHAECIFCKERANMPQICCQVVKDKILRKEYVVVADTLENLAGQIIADIKPCIAEWADSFFCNVGYPSSKEEQEYLAKETELLKSAVLALELLLEGHIFTQAEEAQLRALIETGERKKWLLPR